MIKAVFNVDQYILGLVLDLITFLLPVNSIYFSNCQLMNLLNSKGIKTLQKIDCFYYFWDTFWI